MKTIRAILVGILLWVLIFVEISIVQQGLGVEGVTGSIIHYFLLIPMGILCAWVYYKSQDNVNGFILGIIMLGVGIVLDLVIRVPIFLERNYLEFYSNPYLWVGFLVAVVTVGAYDLTRSK